MCNVWSLFVIKSKFFSLFRQLSGYIKYGEWVLKIESLNFELEIEFYYSELFVLYVCEYEF